MDLDIMFNGTQLLVVSYVNNSVKYIWTIFKSQIYLYLHIG